MLTTQYFTYSTFKSNRIQNQNELDFIPEPSDLTYSLWTDRNGRKTWWTPLEDNPVEENFKVPPAALERIEGIVARGCLPDPKLAVLYAPEARPWQEVEPVKRVPETSQW